MRLSTWHKIACATSNSNSIFAKWAFTFAELLLNNPKLMRVKLWFFVQFWVAQILSSLCNSTIKNTKPILCVGLICSLQQNGSICQSSYFITHTIITKIHYNAKYKLPVRKRMPLTMADYYCQNAACNFCMAICKFYLGKWGEAPSVPCNIFVPRTIRNFGAVIYGIKNSKVLNKFRKSLELCIKWGVYSDLL